MNIVRRQNPASARCAADSPDLIGRITVCSGITNRRSDHVHSSTPPRHSLYVVLFTLPGYSVSRDADADWIIWLLLP